MSEKPKPKCECCGERETSLKIVAPAGSRIRDLDTAPYSAACLSSHGCDGLFMRIRERRAKLAERPRFYGTQPDPLPETLPAGTKTVMNCVAASSLTLRTDTRFAEYGLQYWGAWVGMEDDRRASAGDIDWASTPVDPDHDRATNLGASFRSINGLKAGIQAEIDKVNAAAVAMGLTPKPRAPAQVEPTNAAPVPFWCAGCSSRERPVLATLNGFCAYCATRHGPISEATKALHTERFTVSVEARSRIVKADARARYVPTKTEQELAKGHPASWPSQDGEV